MRKNQRLIPEHTRLVSNEFYLQLNQYILEVLDDFPEYDGANEEYINGVFHYNLNDIESDFYKNKYYLLGKKLPYSKVYNIITDNFDLAKLPINKISEREYDILQLIFGDNKNDMAVLKGNVGWGKSTLLKYVICYLLQFRKNKKITPIYIDFNEHINSFNRCTSRDESIKLFNDILLKKKIIKIIHNDYNIDNEDFWKFIKSQDDFSEYKNLESNYFKLEKRTGTNSIQNLRIEWIKKDITKRFALKYYLQKYNTKLIIFLDNLDPVSDFSSKGIFLEVYKFCREIKAKAVISFRPNTFNEILNKREGIYNTINPKKILLEIPKASDILYNSISLLEERIKIKKAKIELNGITIETNDTFGLIKSFISLLEQKEISDFLDALSQGNLRTWTSLIRTYLSSGHLNSHKLVSNYLKDTIKTINVDNRYNPEWIVYSSIITSNYLTFFPANSAPTHKDIIINLFNNKTWSVNNQLIRLHILFFLSRNTSDIKFLLNRYKRLSKNDFGITKKSIRYAIRILINTGLVKSNKFYKIDTDDEAKNIDDIAITNSGLFYINSFIYKFEYLFYMKDDVELDMKTYDNIKGCLYTSRTNERYSDVFFFIEYLFSIESNYLSSLDINQKNIFMTHFSPFHNSPFYSQLICKELIKYAQNRTDINRLLVNKFIQLKNKIDSESIIIMNDL